MGGNENSSHRSWLELDGLIHWTVFQRNGWVWCLLVQCWSQRNTGKTLLESGLRSRRSGLLRPGQLIVAMVMTASWSAVAWPLLRHGQCLAWCEAGVLRGQADGRVNIPLWCPAYSVPGPVPNKPRVCVCVRVSNRCPGASACQVVSPCSASAHWGCCLQSPRRSPPAPLLPVSEERARTGGLWGAGCLYWGNGGGEFYCCPLGSAIGQSATVSPVRGNHVLRPTLSKSQAPGPSSALSMLTLFFVQ